MQWSGSVHELTACSKKEKGVYAESVYIKLYQLCVWRFKFVYSGDGRDSRPVRNRFLKVRTLGYPVSAGSKGMV